MNPNPLALAAVNAGPRSLNTYEAHQHEERMNDEDSASIPAWDQLADARRRAWETSIFYERWRSLMP